MSVWQHSVWWLHGGKTKQTVLSLFLKFCIVSLVGAVQRMDVQGEKYPLWCCVPIWGTGNYTVPPVWRGQPTIFCVILMSLWRAFLWTTVQLLHHTHTCSMSGCFQWITHKRTTAVFGRLYFFSEEPLGSRLFAEPLLAVLRCSLLRSGLPQDEPL